jgi:hypothetical protein
MRLRPIPAPSSDERGADALERAGGQQPRAVGGESAEQGGAGEEQDAGQERTAAAGDVSDAPAEQQQSTEGEGVGVQDPGQSRRAEAEVLLDVGERYVDDGGVDADHQVGGDDDEEDRAEVGGAARWSGG